MTKLRTLIAAAALFASPALADTTVSYKLPSGVIQLEENDAGQLRVSFGPDSYLLFSGDRAIQVEREGGRERVTDLAAMVRKMGPRIGRLFGRRGAPDPATTQLMPRDGEVTVAGFAGRRYEVRAQGVPAGVELVATNAPEARPASELTARLLDRVAGLSNAAGPDIAKVFGPQLERLKALQGEVGTVLKVGDAFELTGISTAPIPPERFAAAAAGASGR
ncbi:MAG: hypothetical protein INF91_10590 [Alphaproteobacteria bacterium]|nr:hypothetical protein [Alphaproteobacteria bacterium]